MNRRRINLSEVGVFALAVALATPAFAQTTPAAGQASEAPQVGAQPPSGDASVSDIVVTARGVNEKLRDAPASITAFSADTLTQVRAKTGADLVALTPGVSLVAGADNAGDVQIGIRGINGARDAESNVAVVVDGVLKSSKAALVQNQGSLEQVEVLKGPQGAIYGRNAAAGAFVITTRKPGDRLEGQFSGSAGNYKSFSGYGLLSGPVSKSLGVQLSADWSTTDGSHRNSFLPSAANRAVYPGNSTEAASVDRSRQWNVYGRAVWEPSSATQFDAKIRYGELHGSAINFNAIFQLPGLVAATGNPAFNENANDHRFVYASNIDPKNNQTNFEASLRGSQDLGFANLTGYVSYNNFKNDLNADNPAGASFGYFAAEPSCLRTATALQGTPVQAPFGIGGGAFLPPYSPTTCDGTLYERHDQEDYSGELRLASKSGSPLTWQAGLYYLHIDRRDCIATELDTGAGFVAQCYTTGPQARTEQLTDDATTTNVYAVFGAADYQVNERLKVGLALRYDHEERTSINLVPAAARSLYAGNILTGFPNGTPTKPANYYLNPGLDPAYNPSGRLDPRSRSYDQLEPKVTLGFKLNNETNVFANWGIGFKSGGLNPGGTTAIVNGFFNAPPVNAGVSVKDEFKKETSSAFELGIKGRAFDGRLTYNLAGYYTNVRNLQVFELFVGPFGIIRVVENVDRVHIYGGEADVNVRVVNGFNLFASGNYTGSRIVANATRPYTVGNKAPTTPEFTVNAGANFKTDLTSNLKLIGRTDVRVTGPTYFSTVQNNSVPNIFPFGLGNFSNTKRATFTVVNARLSLQRDQFTVSAYVNNLFDKNYIREAVVSPEFGGAFISSADRRFYGMEVGFKF